MVLPGNVKTRVWMAPSLGSLLALLLALLLVLGLGLLGGCSDDDDPAQPGEDPSWEIILDPAYTLRGVWGPNASNFFAVGERGIIRHYRNGDWRSWQINSTAILHGVWGTAADQVVAVGSDGTCYHFDGQDWQARYAGTTSDLNGVWGSAWNDIYACGDDGPPWCTSTARTGPPWTRAPQAQLIHVWGTAADNVYITGSGGTILHYDGSAWSAQESGTVQALDCVWGLAADDIYAVGTLGTIVHWGRRLLDPGKTATPASACGPCAACPASRRWPWARTGPTWCAARAAGP